jgi:hypothetical protein
VELLGIFLLSLVYVNSSVEFKLFQFYLLDFKLRRYNAQITRESVIEYFGTDIIFNHSFKYYKCVVVLPKFY